MGAGRPMTSSQMKDSLEARARLLVKGASRSIIVPPLRHPLDEAGDENRNPHTGPEKNLGRDLFAPSVSTPVFSGRPQLYPVMFLGPMDFRGEVPRKSARGV